MGKDMTRILAWYDAQWSPPFVVLVGYSQGADTLPFMVNRLPLAQQANIRTIALLGAGKKASFAFHMSDWLVNSVREDDVPIKPEADRMQAVAKLCFYGEDEAGDSLCPTLDAKGFTVVKTPGGHHFGGDYRKLAAEILATTGR
jgi:type IV secretory pathway VirJ component